MSIDGVGCGKKAYVAQARAVTVQHAVKMANLRAKAKAANAKARNAMNTAEATQELLNAINGSTITGLIVGGFSTIGGGHCSYAERYVMCTGANANLGAGGGTTIGNVFVTTENDSWVAAHPAVVAHEHQGHGSQYAVGGLAVLPLYGIASAESTILYGNYWQGNVFESGASLCSGGYTCEAH